ncbi:hypothetical protein HRbin24_00371 [bacterium HR24]|nr:hypothetical protein HRbin24_00371 [bacterium HR24]
MGWRETVAGKLVSPQEAVASIRSGDTVVAAPFTCTPYTLCQALYDRRAELRGVRVHHPAGLFQWIREEADAESFLCTDLYATPLNREWVNRGVVDYLVFGAWRDHEIPAGFEAQPDYFLVPVSPPDKHGYCSFGPGVWLSKTWSRQAKKVIAEVHEDFIRTGGENYIHISEIDLLCEGQAQTGALPIPPRSEEEVAVTEVICTLVASEIIKDRDTVQIGIGTVAAALGMYLGDKHDLGIQTEIITGGIAQLVEAGVVTGKYKTLHRGKVVGSACVAMPPEELAMIDGNPVFELYDFGYTDDIRLLVRFENFVAVNNALMVDLTGQVASETIGPRIWTGTAGQLAFMIAARYAPGGRSVIVLPSSHLVQGERRTRIVPALPEGSAVTVPRTLVDYVVTEYGVATLRGKTVRERIGELIAVAHPDFRGELKKEAQRLYGISV